jgi:hypothetical protein
MPIRIGFDMDGVVADLNAALLREARVLFPELDLQAAVRAHPELAPAGPADGDRAGTDPAEIVPPSLRLTPRQQRQLWDAVKSTTNFWETLDETEPGIVARIADTAHTRRWEVIFLTSRPSSAGDIVQVQSQRWLRRHGFEYPSIFVVSTSRGRIASALELDVVIDDRPENCLDVATDSRARSILVWRDTPETAPPGARRLGIEVVSSIADALQQLDVPAEPARPPGLLKRLKGALGA